MRFASYLLESPASTSAAAMGLTYYGFGKYGRGGVVTHESEFGHLTPVRNQYKSENKKLTHLQHIEDEIFNNGVHGVRNALDQLQSVKHMFNGFDERGKLSRKIDGCVHEDTVVMTEKGPRKINDLSDTTMVLGHDFNDSLDKMIYRSKYLVSESDKLWVRIEFDNNGYLICTEDHEIFTKNRGWVPAAQLTTEDEVQKI
jgi:hypothetical protein